MNEVYPWYQDLCEYYNVTSEEVLVLSERKKGRTPSFPGSKTCDPVSGKTWEELWHDKPRETLAQKMEFYKDIGAWQSFRQCNYRKEFPYHIFYNNFCDPGSSILEYGAGVCPMVNCLIDQTGDNHPFKFTMVEVASEHFEFGKWRLQKKAPKTEFNFIEATADKPIPEFTRNFDFVCIMDVLEHLPNPHEVIKNIYNHLNDGAVIVETWVHQGDDGPGEADLPEAEAEREITTKFISDNFNLIGGDNTIRIHQKKKVIPVNLKNDENFEHVDEWLNS